MPLLVDLSVALREEIDLPDYVTNLGDNVEYWMTYLSQDQPWVSVDGNLVHRAKFLRLTRAIGALINHRTSDVLQANCPEWLVKLVHWWHTERAHVITLNNDTLIERAAGLVETDRGSNLSAPQIYPVPFADISRGFVWGYHDVPTFTLYKLHGSVNWCYSGANNYHGETIYSAPAPAWGQYEQGRTLRAAFDTVPLIVPTTTEKVSYFQHETVRQIWAQAGEAITGADRLFVIGYSLPETDLSIRFFLQQHKFVNTTLLIVNQNINVPCHYRRLLQGSYDIDYAYIGANAIEDLVTYLCG